MGNVVTPALIDGTMHYVVSILDGLQLRTGTVPARLIMPRLKIGSNVVVGGHDAPGIITSNCRCYECKNSALWNEGRSRSVEVDERVLEGKITEIHWLGLSEGDKRPVPHYKISVSRWASAPPEGFTTDVWATDLFTRLTDW